MSDFIVIGMTSGLCVLTWGLNLTLSSVSSEEQVSREGAETRR